MEDFWRKCSSCKKEIPFNSPYYVCSVSTCRQKKTDYVFCSVECWDKHIPVERHRGDSVSAIEKQAPRKGEVGRRRVVVDSSSSNSSPKASAFGKTSVDGEILVVASKVKKYISERARMNCSASTMEALTERIKAICEAGIQNAREDGRKTVLDRDIPGL